MSLRVLDTIRVKIDRAEQHINDFNLELAAFLAADPYEVVRSDDPQAGKRHYKVSRVESVPPMLAAAASDAVQNLRAYLDHLAYQLVLGARDGSPPDWKVYFPVARSAAQHSALVRRNI